MNEKKLREAIRNIIKEELNEGTLTPFQQTVKRLFDKNGGKLSVDKLHSLTKGHGEEWQELIDKSYVGKRPGERVWHWV